MHPYHRCRMRILPNDESLFLRGGGMCGAHLGLRVTELAQPAHAADRLVERHLLVGVAVDEQQRRAHALRARRGLGVGRG